MARLLEQTDSGPIAHDLLFQSTSIGRGHLNEIVIDDPGERRLHAEVFVMGRGRYVIRDNRSRGGVAVRGEPIEGPRELADGDLVAVGPATFVFQAGEGSPPPAPGAADRLAGGVARLTAGTLVSRVLGYAREMVAMAYFGASGVLDAYVAATTLPNLFRDVLGEYAAENAFLPTYRTLLSRGRTAEARRLLRSVLRVVVVAGIVLVILGALVAPWLIAALLPGFTARDPALVELATALARWMMPFLLIIAVASLFGSLLLGERRFLLYSLAPAGSSVCVIVAIILLTGRLDVASLGVGIVVGGVVQMVISLAPYLKLRRRDEPPPVAPRRGGRIGLRKVGRSVTPIALAGLLGKVNAIVDRVLASWFCPLGRISALYGAHRLLQLPFGILGLAVGRAAFPSLIDHASANEGDGFGRAVVRALRLNTFLMLPATVAMVVLARPFVSLMFERRAFTAEHSAWVALALACYAAGLVPMGARTVLARAFYALLNTRTPFTLSALGVAVNVVLSIALVLTPLEHGGLALASSVAAWVQAVLLYVLLGRLMARHGRQVAVKGLWAGTARLAACGALMALAMWACALLMGRPVPADGLARKLVTVGVPGLVGLAAYFAAALALRCDEVAALRRRRKPPSP